MKRRPVDPGHPVSVENGQMAILFVAEQLHQPVLRVAACNHRSRCSLPSALRAHINCDYPKGHARNHRNHAHINSDYACNHPIVLTLIETIRRQWNSEWLPYETVFSGDIPRTTSTSGLDS